MLQYAGDNILAAFGVDEAREDDNERAVRCGCVLLQLGRILAAEVEAEHGHSGFDVRVGIHTGSVLLGGGVDAEGTIRGTAVNIAARMEQTAPPGALRISHDTYAHVRGLFEVDVQEPLLVKGVDEPVQSYLVRRVKPRSFRIGARGIEGVATRMVGREPQLEELQASFWRLFADRKLAAITVVADAGIGKSRLLYEFAAWSEARPESFYIFRGRATPQTQGQPFGLLRDILAWRFQIADDDTVEAARAKMEHGIVPLFVQDDGADLAEGHAHLLGHLVGIEWRESRHVKAILADPRQIRNRAFHAAAQMFRRLSASGGAPIILQLEDLHWADSESLDFLAYLIEIDRDVPLLILAFSRPALFERRANWCAGSVHQRIDLAALDKTGSRLLADELLKKLPEIPAALRELVTGGAEGNPFYMEELVKMLIDRGAIEIGQTWSVHAERLLVTHVPATLTGVLQARLDSLPAGERLTLQQASVIGQVFWDQALIGLDEHARDTLPALVRRELALPRGDAAEAGTDDLREYAFKHAILHRVTYATVLKRTRRELHRKLGHWLAAHTGLRANDFLGAAAEHFEEAGDSAHAAEFHARAAEQAQTRLAHEAVMGHVKRGLALIDKASESETRLLRWRLLEAREPMFDLLGDRAAQLADIEAMDALASSLDDNRRRAHAAFRRSVLSMRMADYPATEVAASRAMALAQLSGNTEQRLMAQRSVAVALAFQDDRIGGRALAQEALAEARALKLRRVEGACLNVLAVIAFGMNDSVESLELTQQALRVVQAEGNRREEAINRGNLGGCWLALGQLTQSRIESEEGLRLVRAVGDRSAEAGPLVNLAFVALMRGDDTEALARAHECLETAVAVQERSDEAKALCLLGHAELALGRDAAAGQAYAQMRERALQIHSQLQHDASAGLARVALVQGNIEAALEAIRPLLALEAQAGSDGASLTGAYSPNWIRLTCHKVLKRAGDSRADDWLRQAHEALQTAAARITDARLRHGLLHDITHHREIVAEWTQRGLRL